METGFLDAHCQDYHGNYQPPQWTAPMTTPDPRLYRVSLPRAARSIGCPVGSCEGRATTRTNLQIHFVYRHVRDTVVIMEEVNHPYPCCPACEIFVSWATLNRRHPATALCARGSERKIRRLVEEESRVGSVTEFQDYDTPMGKM